MHFAVADEGAVDPLRQGRTRRQVKHIAVSEQLLGAHLVENGAGIHPGRHLETDAGRDIGLDQAGDDVHRGPLGGHDQVNTGRPRLLRQACNQFFDLLADDHHQVGEFVDHHHDVREGLQVGRFLRHVGQGRLENRVLQRLTLFLGFPDLLVEARQVPNAQCGHQAVAAFHFGDAPAQGIGRFLHVRDDRRQQVRNAFVDRQLQHFRIDHDQPNLLRRGLVEQAQDHRVQRDRFARTSGSCDQDVRHLGDIGNHRIAADALAQGQRER